MSELPHVLILGASSDIARALAHEWAKRKWPLTLAGRRADALEADAADLRIRYGNEVTVVAFDALDTGSHRAFYEGLPHRPDLVACVFGYLGDEDRARTDFEEAKRILDSNFTAAVSILDLVAADLEKRGRGTIVGVSSVAGDRGRAANSHYGAAKAGFTAYLSGLRGRLAAKGVHVLTVKPGFVATKMTAHLPLPPALTAQPGDVARAIVRGADRRRNVIYVRGIWRWIMLALVHLPEFVFKRMKK